MASMASLQTDPPLRPCPRTPLFALRTQGRRSGLARLTELAGPSIRASISFSTLTPSELGGPLATALRWSTQVAFDCACWRASRNDTAPGGYYLRDTVGAAADSASPLSQRRWTCGARYRCRRGRAANTGTRAGTGCIRSLRPGGDTSDIRWTPGCLDHPGTRRGGTGATAVTLPLSDAVAQ